MRIRILLLMLVLALPACADYQRKGGLNSSKFKEASSKKPTKYQLRHKVKPFDMEGDYASVPEEDIEPEQEAEEGEETPKRIDLYEVEGLASWYGPGFHGRKTANGEKFDQHAMTAAHRTLPMGTKLEVTNIDNGESVTVRVNDRGPYSGKRIIDLSKAAADKIGIISHGVAHVRVREVE